MSQIPYLLDMIKFNFYDGDSESLVWSVGPYPKLYDAGAVKFDVRASSSRKSLKKQRRESQQGKDITTRTITEVDQEEEVIAQDTSTSKASINVVAAPRDKVLQACTVTSGLMAALGLVIRKVSESLWKVFLSWFN